MALHSDYMRGMRNVRHGLCRYVGIPLFVMMLSVPRAEACADTTVWDAFFFVGASADQRYLAGVYVISFLDISESDEDETDARFLVNPDRALNIQRITHGALSGVVEKIPFRLRFRRPEIESNNTLDYARLVIVDLKKGKIIKTSELSTFPDLSLLLEREQAWHGSMNMIADGKQRHAELRRRHGKTMHRALELFYQEMETQNANIVRQLTQYGVQQGLMRMRGSKKSSTVLTPALTLTSHFVEGDEEEHAWTLLVGRKPMPLSLDLWAVGMKPPSHVMQFQQSGDHAKRGVMQFIRFFLNNCHDGINFEQFWIMQ